MNVFGYARVSTKEQKLEVQEDAIKKHCEMRNFTLVRLFEDKASGKDTKRQEFQNMIGAIENDNVLDVQAIIIYKLDRVGRSIRDLLKFVDWCKKNKIELISITDNIDTTTHQGRFFFYISGAIAEYERELIRERIEAGKAKYIANGGKFGRKAKNIPIDVIRAKIKEGVPITKIAKALKVDRTTIYRRLNDDDLKKLVK